MDNTLVQILDLLFLSENERTRLQLENNALRDKLDVIEQKKRIRTASRTGNVTSLKTLQG